MISLRRNRAILSSQRVLGLAVLGLVATLAGCSTPPPPEPVPLPPPPPPPVVIVTPPRPTPPDNAAPGMEVPPTDAAGLRQSLNRGITPAQTVWNFRSAWNVAALDCNRPNDAAIQSGYRSFLTDNSRALAKANRAAIKEFQDKYGSTATAAHERYMTAVYNHFALPPTLPYFCDAVLAVARDAVMMQKGDLDGFATRSLPSLEVIFDDFYRRYDKYRLDLADWQARYGVATAPVAAAPVAGPVVAGAR